MRIQQWPIIALLLGVFLGSCGSDDTVIITGGFDGTWTARLRFDSSECNNPSDVPVPPQILVITQTEQEITATSGSYTYRGTVASDNSSFTVQTTFNDTDCRGTSTIEFSNADLERGEALAFRVESYTCGSGDSLFARIDYYCGSAARQ
jgi:hypothetical protein